MANFKARVKVPKKAKKAVMPTHPNPQQTPQSEVSSPSFVKLAMKNMVRKGRQSLLHLGLTATGFLGFILIVAWLGRPNLPH